MTDMPWLRLYTDTVDNEKIRLLAFEDRWHYIAILCCMQQGILKKNDKLLERKLSVKLGLQTREVEEVKRRLMEVNLIDNNFVPIGWEKHQFKSDNSTDRVRKYRENKAKKECNVTETLLKRKCNAIDTDTEQIHTKIKTKNRVEQIKNNTVNGYKNLLNEFGIDGQLAEDFVIHRKSKKAAITKTVMDGYQKEADKAGISITDAVRTSIERNWQGYKAEWDIKKTIYQSQANKTKEDRNTDILLNFLEQ